MNDTNISLPPATGTLRALQLKMLDILIEIDKLCRKHNIIYWMDFGTLLGAVRHGGFIPWDDDMDITMPEADFLRFQTIAIKELPDWLFLQNEYTDKSSKLGNGLIKVRDNNSILLEGNDFLKNNYNRGIFVDIFRAKECPKVPIPLYRYITRRIMFSRGFFRYPQAVNWHNIICYFIYPLSAIWHSLLRFILTVGRKSIYYVPVADGCTSGYPTKISDILPIAEISFEGHKFLCPNNYDQCLKNEFGDYMKLPEKSQRRTHVKYILLDKSIGEATYEY